mmetsp:Transcript_15283/g.20159  ORF Transcript_15283/g.20159 Transcript_15283/m.20159 type:complete len:216 (+) Transcript_15283:118-765(+)|eukprot:CAMPEP_0117756726 /NCGR_PEP_ID=MMETSP0947-20121206/14266_1 /TAXON_ID=44440 /ORGANISM="Chattonella subsalsa, Strain CCMP2191" /LENGTH=215 /DNA_ID=CAMNT_0005576401 /DNA_START=111 /DNA_END=758 /DNA_ORIENTATION=-
MTILYGLVARNKTVLAEYTFTSGNFPTITRVLLGKIPETDSKMSYVYDKYVFHYLVSEGLTYLCMADDNTKRRLPFAFLEDIKNRFQATYGDRAQSAIAFAMNEDFGRTLQKQMEYFNGPEADQYASVNKKLDDVKNIMVQNIEMVLERGEKLELLVDKSDRLSQQAFVFEKTSKKLKQAMFWKKVKAYSVIAFVLLILLYILLAIACGPTFKKC